MNDLIEALTIISKYITDKHLMQYPTSCEHDTLFVHVQPAFVSTSDIRKLIELGFYPDHKEQYFYSYKYGSN